MTIPYLIFLIYYVFLPVTSFSSYSWPDANILVILKLIMRNFRNNINFVSHLLISGCCEFSLIVLFLLVLSCTSKYFFFFTECVSTIEGLILNGNTLRR